MKIKICQQNAEKIEAALDAVNGKAMAPRQVINFAEQMEDQLRLSGLPLSERKGVTSVFTPAGPTAKSYRYGSKSTSTTIERGGKGWFLVRVAESTVCPKNNAFWALFINERHEGFIVKHALRSYVTKPREREKDANT